MASDPDARNSWLQVRFTCDADTAAQLAEHLSDCGALSVSLGDAEDDPLYEPQPGTTPLWAHTRVCGLFEDGEDTGRLLDNLARRMTPVRLPSSAVEVLEDREWARAHQDDFEPVCFGGRLWVVPSWAERPALAREQAREQLFMTLDPGLAFGTGSHPSTALCLEWLCGEDVTGAQAVDYGCGSGILAVAAAMLGARRVSAVDNDPQALAAAERNTAVNGVADRVDVRGPGHLPALTADLLMSNILANTLCSMARELCALLTPGGRLALAGILREQSPQVIERFAPWCALHISARRDEWVLLCGARGDDGA